MKLHFESFDAQDAPTHPDLVLVHGLLGQSRNFFSIARKLCQNRRVLCFDMRNHGRSDWAQAHRYDDMAQDLAQALSDLKLYDIYGHSMGGKAVMHGLQKGVLKPRRAIIGDIAPVSYRHTQAHNISAMRAIDLSKISRRSEIVEALLKTLDDPLEAQFLAQSAILTPEKRWGHNLEILQAEMPHIMAYDQTLPKYETPLLFICGANSDYVRAEDVKPHFPNTILKEISNAGHWVHADNPGDFLKVLTDFINDDI